MRRMIALALFLANCTEAVEDREREAAAFASKLGFDTQGVSCANSDSDGDGYVSCTVSVRNESKLETLAVECASQWRPFMTGCRLQKLGLQRNR